MDNQKPWEAELAPSVQIFSALAHPLRLALSHCLCERPHTVGELHECLGVSQPLASHHLKILHDAHIVAKRQEGRNHYYFISDEHIRHIINDVDAHTKESKS